MRSLIAPLPRFAFATIDARVPATYAIPSYRARSRSWRDVPIWPVLVFVWAALIVTFFASLR